MPGPRNAYFSRALFRRLFRSLVSFRFSWFSNYFPRHLMGVLFFCYASPHGFATRRVTKWPIFLFLGAASFFNGSFCSFGGIDMSFMVFCLSFSRHLDGCFLLPGDFPAFHGLVCSQVSATSAPTPAPSQGHIGGQTSFMAKLERERGREDTHAHARTCTHARTHTHRFVFFGHE